MIFYVDDFPGRVIHHGGKSYTYFGGTAYLGLQTDTGFQKLFIRNIKQYGPGYSASRRANVRFSVYEKAEATLAALAGSEACITVSSGYLAGQLVRSYFDTSACKAFYAPSAHPALHRRGTTNHSSFDALNAAVTSHLKTHPEITPVVYIDTIDPQGSSYPGFNPLRSLPLQHIILVADDSHGLGITGPQGGGAYKTLRELRSKELVVCGSLGKGFGIQAGAVFGSKSFINALAETDMVIASSPAAPAALATFLQAQQLYAEKRRALLHNITTFTAAIQLLSRFRYIENYPAFSYADKTLSVHLSGHNIITTHFKYPSENAGTVSRIVLSAHHTGADILQLVTAVNSHPTKPLH